MCCFRDATLRYAVVATLRVLIVGMCGCVDGFDVAVDVGVGVLEG